MRTTNKFVLSIFIVIFSAINMSAQVEPEDLAPDFSLPDVHGKLVSLSDYQSSKGIVLIFTSNTCPFAVAYEQRIIKLHKNYAAYGYPVLLINSNSTDHSPEESIDEMKKKAEELDFQFPYLKDASQTVCKAYGVSRNPQVFVIKHTENKFEIAYVGAIDDNVVDDGLVAHKYVENALRSIETGEKPDPGIVNAVGCSIK